MKQKQLKIKNRKKGKTKKRKIEKKIIIYINKKR